MQLSAHLILSVVWKEVRPALTAKYFAPAKWNMLYLYSWKKEGQDTFATAMVLSVAVLAGTASGSAAMGCLVTSSAEEA